VSDIFPDGTDPTALDDLAAAGVGEGDFAEDGDHDVPADLTELWIDLAQQGKTPDDLAAWAEAAGP
jgi:hypothetical protein